MSRVEVPLRVVSPDSLAEFVERHPRLFVLTGAGCSTGSGIPDYRDADGEWKRGRPVMLQDFVADEHSRKRYWARGLVGCEAYARRAAERRASLARGLERQGRIAQLVTQNVDGLHQAAGSQQRHRPARRVDVVRCMSASDACRASRCKPSSRGAIPTSPRSMPSKRRTAMPTLDGRRLRGVRRARLRHVRRAAEARRRVLRRARPGGTRPARVRRARVSPTRCSSSARR